jgi:hypothetical protein
LPVPVVGLDACLFLFLFLFLFLLLPVACCLLPVAYCLFADSFVQARLKQH